MNSHKIAQPTTLSHTIESVAFEYETAFDVDTFSSWIRMFVTLNQQTIFRIKGILCFANLPGKFILQVVGDIVTFSKIIAGTLVEPFNFKALILFSP